LLRLLWQAASESDLCPACPELVEGSCSDNLQ